MNDKIDVLAVMDRAAESAGKIVKESNGDFRAVIYQDDLFKARAAIAELIEVAKDARDSLLAANKAYSDGAIGILIERLSATLESVGGA